MKTFFLTLLLSSFIFATASGQSNANTRTTQDILMSCIWESLPKNNSGGYARYEEYFSKDKVYFSVYYRGEIDTSNPFVKLYYFSNTIDNEFDKSKVGKLTHGKYIIKDNTLGPEINEILKVSDKRLDLKKLKIGVRTEEVTYALTYRSEK